jgi:hypothetical protein
MKVKTEKMEKVLRIEANLGGGAGAKLGVKLSKTDLVLPKIPLAGVFSPETSVFFREYSSLNP